MTVCSRPEDGLICRQGVKPQLNQSINQSINQSSTPQRAGSTTNYVVSVPDKKISRDCLVLMNTEHNTFLDCVRPSYRLSKLIMLMISVSLNQESSQIVLHPNM